MHRSIRILAAAVVVSSSSPGLAQQVHSSSVTISQSDFATARSQAGLNHRIQLAVEDICGVNAMAEDESWREIKQCQLEVRQQFAIQIAAIRSSGDVQLTAR